MTITRLVPFVALGLGITALAGCPVYDDSQQGSPLGGGSTRACGSPYDCQANEVCSADGICSGYDCATVGCIAPYICQLSSASQGPVCVAPSSVGQCSRDTDCAAQPGTECVNGTCVAPTNKCTDGSQCKGGATCVEGACVPACSNDKPCPTGYACDEARGVCIDNPGSCGDGGACTDGTVCVTDRCVAPCGDGGTCSQGLICVNGGCIVDETPATDCDVDGQRDKCREGSICLRHSCYIACEADAGDSACKSADTFNVCKAVTTSSGTHHVCGSEKSLGSECDAAQGKACTGSLICIDGYCR